MDQSLLQHIKSRVNEDYKSMSDEALKQFYLETDIKVNPKLKSLLSVELRLRGLDEAYDGPQGLEPLLQEFVEDVYNINTADKIKRRAVITSYYRAVLSKSKIVGIAYRATRRWALRAFIAPLVNPKPQPKPAQLELFSTNERRLNEGFDLLPTRAVDGFDCNCWAWRHIHSFLASECSDILSEEQLNGMSYNDGVRVLAKQASVIAQRALAKLAQPETDIFTRQSNEEAGWIRDNLKEFAEFAAKSGGFRVF